MHSVITPRWRRAPRPTARRALWAPLLFALVLTALSAARATSAGTLTITAPADGSSVPQNSVTIRAVASGFAPSSVDFYEAEGTPDDNWADAIIGHAARAADGSYTVTDDFTDGPGHLVYAQAMDGATLVRGLCTFAVDRRTGTVSVTVTNPPEGGVVTSRTNTVRAVVNNYKATRVDFYEAEGTPDDNWADRLLGSDRDPAADGSFEVTADFADGPGHLVYAEVFDGFSTTRGLAHFTVDRRSGPTALDFVVPANNSIVTGSNTVTVRAMPVNFKPDQVQFYQAIGTIDDNWADRALGTDRAPALDGSFEVSADFTDGGPYLVYAEYFDGFETVRGQVNFSVLAKPTLSLGISSAAVTSCSEVIGTVTMSPAPSGGALVTLRADSPAVTLPPSVLIPAGQASASFPIGGQPVRESTPVTLTATVDKLSATASLAAVPYPHDIYTVEDLGTLGGSYSVATGINASGVVVGYAPTASGVLHAFRATGPGTMADISPESTVDVLPQDINDAGRIVGSTQAGSNAPRTAFRTDAAGALVPLATPGATDASAQAIRADGEAVGEYKAADGNLHAFRADAAGAVNDLGVLPGGSYSHAFGLNDAGQVAGYGDDAQDVDCGFRTGANGTVDAAAVLSRYSYSYALNRDGATTGWMWNDTDATYHLFRTDTTDTPKDLGSLPKLWTCGWRINASGDIAATAYAYDSGSGSLTETAAAVYTDAGGLRDLNTLLPEGSGWQLIAAYAVNDAGQIVGYGAHEGQYRAFRLTPTVPNANYGDADGDGKVTGADVIALLRMAGGLVPVGNRTVCDVAPAPACNARGFGDGRVDVQDALRVARRLGGLEPVWP